MNILKNMTQKTKIIIIASMVSVLVLGQLALIVYYRNKGINDAKNIANKEIEENKIKEEEEKKKKEQEELDKKETEKPKPGDKVLKFEDKDQWLEEVGDLKSKENVTNSDILDKIVKIIKEFSGKDIAKTDIALKHHANIYRAETRDFKYVVELNEDYMFTTYAEKANTSELGGIVEKDAAMKYLEKRMKGKKFLENYELHNFQNVTNNGYIAEYGLMQRKIKDRYNIIKINLNPEADVINIFVGRSKINEKEYDKNKTLDKSQAILKAMDKLGVDREKIVDANLEYVRPNNFFAEPKTDVFKEEMYIEKAWKIRVNKESDGDVERIEIYISYYTGKVIGGNIQP